MVLCSEAVLVNQGIDAARAVTLKCRSWNCDICQPERQAKLIAEARAGHPTTFITLTANPNEGRSAFERARGLVEAWRQVVKRAKKAYGYETVPYLCVFEATKRGEPHLHILCRVRWIGQKWLSAQMKQLTNSPIVDIRKVNNQRSVAHYVSKYIGKAPHRFETCKRYWKTKNYETENFKREPEVGYWAKTWEIRDTCLASLRDAWVGMGWEVSQTRHMLLGRARGPPDDFGAHHET